MRVYQACMIFLSFILGIKSLLYLYTNGWNFFMLVVSFLIFIAGYDYLKKINKPLDWLGTCIGIISFFSIFYFLGSLQQIISTLI